MYDPEFGFEHERILESLTVGIESAMDQLPENHPFLQAVQSYRDGFEAVGVLKSDLDNCYDEDERKRISDTILKLIAALEKVSNVLKKLDDES